MEDKLKGEIAYLLKGIPFSNGYGFSFAVEDLLLDIYNNIDIEYYQDNYNLSDEELKSKVRTYITKFLTTALNLLTTND